ncbi:putative permease [Haloferax mucosum ATCC BAA-1512]|uniref:Putative permease n=1 Tax=Haloferax mucosum ATCC BAA-1512 TaxID=662479 RepID=M0IM15_9EURY|nr:permease [Haloferax mucosum]ELZ97057.1 putative permease [Haloferax mucosum ATCC BAA-1512]
MTSDGQNRLIALYRDYVGADADETTVYLGFALFFTAIGLLAVALATVLWSGGIPPENIFKYELREVAGVTGAIGLPLLLTSIVVLLPTKYRLPTIVVAVVGLIVCAVGVNQFVNAYPHNWNVEAAADRSGKIVGIYATGAVAVVAASGTTLVGFQLSRARTPAPSASDDDPDADDGVDEEAVSEQVRRDMDEALSNTDLSWGGVRKKETTRLKLDTSSVDDIDRTSFENATVNETRGGSVDDAVTGLQGLRGGETDTAVGESTDDQAAALSELRKQQQATEESESTGLLDRIRGLFS